MQRLKFVTFLLWCFSTYSSYAQTCASTSSNYYEWPGHKNWFFAPNLWQGTVRDMQTGVNTTVGYVGLGVTSYEGTTAASDDQGNLLFYANGRRMWRNTGGATTLISGGLLTGNEGGTNTNGSASQGIITLRHPLDPENYYVFTVDCALDGTRGLNYFIYNSNTQVFSGPTRLGSSWTTTEGVAATRHSNGVDVWITVLQRQSNNFRTFLLTCSGVNSTPVTSAVGPNTSANKMRGALAFSNDGTKFAQAHPNFWPDSDREVSIYNFNKTTGVINNEQKISSAAIGESPYDVTFSPDGGRLYISEQNGSLDYYNLNAGGTNAIRNSYRSTGVSTGFSAIEIGPDGNLYKTSGTSGGGIQRVNGNLNSSTSFSQSTLSGTNGKASLGLPSMYIPPAEEPDIDEVGPYTTCDGTVDLSTNWMCVGIDAEDPVNYPVAYQGTGITNTGTGIFDPSIAGVGTHEIIFTRCSVDDTIHIVVSSCCPDTTLAGSFSPVCAGNDVIDLTTVENGKTGTWSISNSPLGGIGSVTGGHAFNVNNSVTGTYELTFSVAGASVACIMPTRSIIVNQAPSVSVNSESMCDGDPAATFTMTAPTAISQVWSGNGSGTGTSVTGSASGSYIVTVTDANTCTNSATGTLTINAIPTVSVNSESICDGDPAATFTMTAPTAVSQVWSGNGSGTGTSITGSTSGSYTLTVTDANTCTNSATGTLTINAVPAVSVNSESICDGGPAATFTMTAPTAVSQVWSGNGSGTGTSITGSASGSYTVTVTDANTCTNSATGILIINTLPSVSVNSESICDGDPAATFTMTAPTAVSQVWSGNGSGTSTSVTGSTSGSYTVTVTDANTCTNSATGTLTINAVPAVSVNNESICDGDPAATFTMTAPTAVSQVWSGNGSGTGTSVTGSTSGSYTLTVTDANTCTNSATGTLTINAVPLVSVNSESICDGDPAATFTMTAPTTVSQVWSGNGSGTATSVTGSASGSYTVTVTDANTCTNSATGILTLDAAPSVSVNSESICDGDPAATFTMTAPTAVSQVWSGNGAGTATSVTGSASGSYTVTVTDANTCTNSATGILTINIIPTVSVNSESICDGDPAATFTMTAPTAVSQVWSGNGTGTNPSATGSAAGSYTVTVTDVNTCANSATGILRVDAAPSVSVNSESMCDGDPAATFTMTAPTAVSQVWSGNGSGTGTSVTGSASGSYIVTVTDANTCTNSATGILTINATPTVSVNSESICDGDPAATFIMTAPTAVSQAWSENGSGISTSVTGSTSGSYTVTVTDANTCTNYATGTLTINAIPAVSVNNESICDGDPAATFTMTAPTAVSQVWSGNGSGTGTSVTGSTSGSYTLTVTDANTCTNSATGTLTINAVPAVSVNSESICDGDPAATFTMTAPTAVSQVWSGNGSGISTSVTGSTSGSYTVTVTDANTCTNSATGTLTINAVPAVSVNSESICDGDPATTFAMTAPTAVSQVWSGNSAGTSTSVTGSTSGSYTVTVTDANTCTNSATGILTINAVPAVSVNNESICDGDPAAIFTMTAPTAASQVWSGNGSATNATATGSTAGAYTVTVTDANACTNSATGTLTVHSLPAVSVNSESICDGDPTAIFTMTAPTSVSQVWSGNGSGTNPTTTGSIAGAYTVTVTDANACTNASAGTLTVHSLPAVSVNSESICDGDPAATFVMTSPTAVSQVWSGNGSGTNPTASGTEEGSYTVTVTDANTCVNTAAALLTVNPVPNVTLNDGNICPGSNLQFDAGAGFSYLWHDGSTIQNYTCSSAETVHVKITNGNGCIDSDTAIVSVNANLLVNLGTDQSLCDGEHAVFEVNSSGFTSATHAILWNTGETSDSIKVSASSQVVVSVIDPLGCSGTDTANVVVNAKPSLNMTNQRICAGDASVVFDAGVGYTSYIWSGTLTGSGQSIVTDVPGTYTVEVTDVNNCKDTADVDLTVFPIPVLDLGVDRAMCIGSTVQFDVGNGYAYLWHDGSSNQTYTASSAEQVHVLITDLNGCENRDTANVSIQSALTVSAGPDTSFCEGNTIELKSGYPNAGHTITWNTSEISSDITVSSAGTYSVEVVDGSGCRGTDTVQVSVNLNPMITLHDTAICAGDPPVSFDPGSNAGWQYTWSGDTQLGEVLTNQIYSSSSAGTYDCLVTDGNSCTNMASAVLTLHALPTVDIGDTVKVCPGNTALYTATGNGVSFEWNDNPTEAGSSYTSKLEGEIWVQVKNSNNCIANDTSYLANLPAVTVSFGGDVDLCEGESVVLISDKTGPSYSYDWADGINFSESITVSPITTTSYELFVVDGGGCPGYGTVVVNVNLNPLISLVSDTICAGDPPVTFDAGHPGGTFLWSADAAGQVGQTFVSSSQGNFTVTVTDSNSCKGVGSASLVVNALPSPQMQDEVMCQGGAGVNFGPGAAYVQYLWSGHATGQTTPSVMGTQAGVYSVEVTDVNGCKNTTHATLVVDSMPSVDLGPDLAICEGEEVVLSNQLNPDVDLTMSWSNGSTDPEIIVDSAGSYEIVVTDSSGCVGSDTLILRVNPFPLYTKSSDTVLCFELTDYLVLSVDAGIRNEVVWETGENSEEIEATEQGLYPFTVSTSFSSCALKDTIEVLNSCKSSIFVPNAFTPDGDGTNDYFFAETINVSEYDLYVYSRWGDEVFHTSSPKEGWDGNFGGKEAQIDVYVWKIYYSTEEDYGGRQKRTKTGTVTLVR